MEANSSTEPKPARYNRSTCMKGKEHDADRPGYRAETAYQIVRNVLLCADGQR